MQDILSERTKVVVREGKGREMDGLLAGVLCTTANEEQVPVDMTGGIVNLSPHAYPQWIDQEPN